MRRGVVVAALFVIPLALNISVAGAANPHGSKSDPSATCQHAGQGKPSGQCDDQNLPQSEGCEHGQAPVQNPHCIPTTAENPPTTSTPTPPTSTPTSTPSPQPPAPNVSSPKPPSVGSGNKGPNEGPGSLLRPRQEAGSNALPNQLAFTGLPVVPVALVGALMLGTGLLLRRRFLLS